MHIVYIVYIQYIYCIYCMYNTPPCQKFVSSACTNASLEWTPEMFLFPLPPVLLLLSLYKAESHSLLPMSLAFSSPCFHCRCIVGEPRPPVFLPPCLSWSPSFVDFPFLIRTPFFLFVCMFWCVLPLVVWRRWRRKAPKEGKGTGTLKVRVPRRTGGEGVERGRKGGLF